MRNLIVGLTLLILACSSVKQEDDKSKVEKTIKDFLVWYSTNWDSISVRSTNRIIENWAQETYDSTKFYRINFTATETYLGIFSKSGFVSEVYLNEWREYFIVCQNEFEINPQNMGPPSGFEYEFVFRGQMYDGFKNNPDKAFVAECKITDNKAIATVDWKGANDPRKYNLSKIGNDWKIDRIRAYWEESK